LGLNHQAILGELRWQIISFDRGLDAISPKYMHVEVLIADKWNTANQNRQKGAVKIACQELDGWYFNQPVNVLVAARQRGCVKVSFIQFVT